MNKKRPLYKDLIITLIACLVFTMTLGSFGAVSTYAAVSEVIFTPQETAENILNGIDVPVSSKYQGLIEYNILSGGDVFKGSGECWGYAEKVRKLFGNGGGKRTTVKKKNTPENFYKILKNVRPGTHVRFGDTNSGDGRHSIVVYKVTKDKIYFSDANVAGPNVIRHMVVDIGFFSQKYAYVLWYIQPTGGYTVRTPKVKGFSYDLTDKIEIAWQPVTGAKSYAVYRSNSKNGKYTKIKTVKKPYYVDKKIKSGANWYKVKPNNGSTSKAVCVYDKLLTPTVRETATNAGYSKLSWDKIKGAKKYGVYERAYNAKGGYYKLVQTVKGTSCTYKGTEDTYVYVRAIASNSKANSQYLEVYAIRYAPQPVITGGEVDKKDGTRFNVKVKLPYGHTNDHESLMINLYRSDTKDGYYQFVDQAAVFGMMYDNSFDHDPNQYTRKKFTKDSVITLTDYSFRGNTEYYYKAVAVKGSSNMRYGDSGLDSKPVKLTTPELPVIGEEFGSAGTLYRHTDGTLAYFVDNDGNKYTEGLELERFWEGYLYYGDTEGHKFKAYKDGKVYFYDEVSGEYKKVEEGTNEG